MPRVAGQIDLAKGEAILDAAVEVLGERGLGASMEEVARRAGVSRQTIYNHYGSKAELIRALVDRRVADITAPLEMPGADEHPEEALADFARTMLQAIISPRSTAMMRLYIQGAAEAPDVARAVFEAGPKASRARLAAFLARETADGRLSVDNPAMAAEFFGGMVVGTYQLADLLGVDRELTDAQIDAIAIEASRRFMRAYSV
ncbi:MAG: TetR/AcrR family transcriptional regulator [Phenylobacterium sp.]|jgi:TetR/AcrR family transcriptional repressor of mexJK operon|uniref:TetR/AcrR family transcriptional regulator n=1 Tax=Phenylobacterium sp. TaxID=1871053 RepID=UPI001B72A38E|nr:TetR/AcrR family transcriptional regulator [Phenylobacterium sp.]MBP7817346.1 TetR/AcrR family transcriptional regulator [Phenylobacterium sp.]MBP9232066.1 TetR/AcrR family transcriptional regulator [Phenylobacterium sp.]MBP9754937.1 TetR/AcrR family transcriptional regulator [Phenylobacterium sp.]